MYCQHCGKQLSDEAIMCPECGTPTSSSTFIHTKREDANSTSEVSTSKSNSWCIVSFVLSVFAFVTGVIFGRMIIDSYRYASLLFVIGHTSITPALTAISVAVISLRSAKISMKVLAIIGIALSGILLIFLSIAIFIACV